MSFLNITPVDGIYLNYNVGPIRLRVAKNNGVEVSPDVNINIVDLNKGDKYFINNSSSNDTFKIDIVIDDSDVFYGGVDGSSNLSSFKVIDGLDYWIRNMIPLQVVIDSSIIPDGTYIISKNDSRKHTNPKYMIWELEFTKYQPVPYLYFNQDNTYADKAVADYLASKAKKTTTSSASSLQLKDCNTNQFKYRRVKTVFTCVKWLQELLKKKGYYNGVIDGWYGPMTMEAVKKFQRAYKKKNLLVDGWCGPVTLACLIGG